MPSKNLKPKKAFLLSFADTSGAGGLAKGDENELAEEKFIAVDELEAP